MRFPAFWFVEKFKIHFPMKQKHLGCIYKRKLLASVLPWIPTPVGVRHEVQGSRAKRSLWLAQRRRPIPLSIHNVV